MDVYTSVKFKFITNVMDWFPKQVRLERLYILETEDKIWWCSVIEGSPILSHFEGGLAMKDRADFFCTHFKVFRNDAPLRLLAGFKHLIVLLWFMPISPMNT